MVLALMPHQKQALKFALENKRCLLRLDTGLGKTAVCLKAAKYILKSGGEPRVLVVVPAFLKKNWQHEMEKWGVADYGIQLASYEYVRDHLKSLKGKLTCVIFDEAHYLKNIGSKRTKAALELCSVTPRVILATASPYVRSAEDFYPIMQLLKLPVMPFKKFRDRYCMKRRNMYTRSIYPSYIYYSYNQYTVGEIRKALEPKMISFRKADVLKDMPEKNYNDIYIDVGTGFALKDGAYIDETGELVLPSVSKLNVELGLAKAEAVVETARSIIANEDKLIIFCKHIEVAKLLEHKLSEDYKVASVTGDIEPSRRSGIVSTFKRAPDKYILIATIGALGVGANLQFCSNVLFAEMPWSYTEMKQAEDRVYRIGTSKPVFIHRIIAESSLDDLIIKHIRDKEAGESVSVGLL